MRAYQRFYLANTASDARWVEHAASYLRGQAWAWFEPRMREYQQNPEEPENDETRAIFSDYNEFEERFLKVFGDNDEERKAERELARLKQTKSATAYAATFRQITSNLDWDDEPLMARFYEGLKDDIKDELIKADRPEDLTTYIEMAVRIDQRLYERRMERGSRTKTIPWTRPTQLRKHTGGRQQYFKKEKKTYYGDPMELDTLTTKDEGCFLCGKEGHFKRDCPQNKKKNEWKKNDWRKTSDTRQANLTTKKDLEVTQYDETSKELEHRKLNWTVCYDDSCSVHYKEKDGAAWRPRKVHKTRSLCVMERAKHHPQHLRPQHCDCELCKAANDANMSQMEQDPNDEECITQQGEDIYELRLDQVEIPTVAVSMLTAGPQLPSVLTQGQDMQQRINKLKETGLSVPPFFLQQLEEILRQEAEYPLHAKHSRKCRCLDCADQMFRDDIGNQPQVSGSTTEEASQDDYEQTQKKYTKNDKPYQGRYRCILKECQYEAYLRRDINRHIRDTHREYAKERGFYTNYKCTACQQVFTRKDSLRRHQRSKACLRTAAKTTKN